MDSQILIVLQDKLIFLKMHEYERLLYDEVLGSFSIHIANQKMI